ncbi:MAG: methyltransferase, partial [Pseudomonadota bacterium]
MRLGWAAWRNRTIASPRFQRFAARFPLTRPIANAHARALFDLTAGFVYSQLLAAAVSLGVIERLSAAPAGTPELARAAGVPDPAMARLLQG